MIHGLHLPHLSAYDPPVAGEGTLYPLGMFTLAEGLADELAPWITARMWRIRFVTAIAVAARALDTLRDEVAEDGVTPPYLVFEWILAEALAAQRDFPREATIRVPGIEKARAARVRGRHLDALSYLKTPKVFGFQGIYKRLAIGMRVVDRDLGLLERGDQLLRAWEREQGVTGYADGRPHSEGRRLLDAITREVSVGLGPEGITLPAKSYVWSRLASTLRPDGAGPQERALLTQWLMDPSQPLQREFVLGIREIDQTLSETAAIEAISGQASPAMARMLEAVLTYERLARLLHTGLDVLRRASTAAGTKPIHLGELAGEPLLMALVRLLPGAYVGAAEALELVGRGASFEADFGRFRDMNDPVVLAEELLARHRDVQQAKPPAGKRPWFEDIDGAFVVRPPYRLDQPPALTEDFVHPYRVGAVQEFLRDLR